ncbi:MAG: Glycine cleavage system protein T, partial [uncultured Sulfurovum sp.]
MEELLKTPLYNRQQELKTKNVSFCGWDMPIQFDGIIAEHGHC